MIGTTFIPFLASFLRAWVLQADRTQTDENLDLGSRNPDPQQKVGGR
jgi:hypothetical protein